MLTTILLSAAGLITILLLSGNNSANYAGITDDNITMLKKLVPKAQPFFVKFLKESAKAGFNLRITFGWRSFAEQTALYAQGRYTLEQVNKLRQIAGLYLLKKQSENYIVTYAKAGESFHNFGLAIDIVDRVKGYNIDWVALRKIAVSCGLEYIPDTLTFSDKPHFQKTFGYKTSELTKALQNKTLEKLLS